MEAEKTQTQLSQTAENTFSAQVGQENVLANAAFVNSESNTNVLAEHRRGNLFRVMWILLALLLLASLGFVVYIVARSQPEINKLGTAADNFGISQVDLNAAQASGAINGQLTINGNQLNNGDLTVLGTTNIATDLNVGGNASIGGTLTASNLVGTINASNISGFLQPAQLDPFIAYTNRNFQAFTGTNQTFRNSSNSVGAFEIQDSAAAPILSANTITGAVTIGESAASQSGLLFETDGNGRFAGTLQVGADSNPDTSILNTGPLFSNDIQRVLTVQAVSTDNSVANRIFAGTSAELLADPIYSPVTIGTVFGFDYAAGGNLNIYTGGYSALQTSPTNTQDFYLNGGSLSGFTHTGTGTVLIGNGAFNTIGNLGTGTIDYALGNAVVPVTNNGGLPNGVIKYYSGFSAIDPSNPVLTLLGFPISVEPGTIDHQVGLQVMEQHSGTVGSANIVSEGYTSVNYFEGKINVGTCADGLTPTSAIATAFCFTGAPGGQKLQVNAKTSVFDDTAASLIVHSAIAADKPLVVVGVGGQTADLTQWQAGGGLFNTALSVVNASGQFGVNNTAPGFDLHVGNSTIASGTTVARFENAGGTCDITPNVVGAVTCTSDIRVKKNIVELTDTLEKLGAIKVYSYNLTAEQEGDPVHVGFLAQELEEIMPDLVRTDAQGMKSVSYAGLTPYLVQALKQQQLQIDELKATQESQNTTSIDVLTRLKTATAIELDGDLTINGAVIIKGRLAGNANTRGQLTIPAGQKIANYSFPLPYTKIPNVVISPNDDPGGRYWLASKSAAGFSIELESAQPVDTVFSFQVQE